MKNLPILTILALGAITLTAKPVLAAGSVMYREVKSNNLFECSTNQQIEHIWTGGNSTSYGSTHTLICLDGDRKAKWVMTSKITCQSRNIKLKECPTWFNNEHTQNEPNQFPIKGSFSKLGDTGNTYLYNPQKTGIGTNCKIFSETSKYGSVSYNWTCEKYASYENLTINTKGLEDFQSTGGLFRKYGKIPSQFQLETPEEPNCNRNQSNTTCSQDYPALGGDRGKLDPRIYIDCRGDAKFCDWYYSPQPFE
ncbi:hypothetical protein H6F42_10525 [Pseudanabaena sp. FACHB-1998]|uniref:hypothetical protein n=1 Tax=Pseudanabaena sp. FACHB-1998 TaxID=2692858 RepID=UPI0016816244|nr:hypothetical protein [Pseudanabaena sp. FACHB-1998]MBD2177345.1 hypothetical protein [Pseudanabaena sp. FACHB-1998]